MDLVPVGETSWKTPLNLTKFQIIDISLFVLWCLESRSQSDSGVSQIVFYIFPIVKDDLVW